MLNRHTRRRRVAASREATRITNVHHRIERFLALAESARGGVCVPPHPCGEDSFCRIGDLCSLRLGAEEAAEAEADAYEQQAADLLAQVRRGVASASGVR